MVNIPKSRPRHPRACPSWSTSQKVGLGTLDLAQVGKFDLANPVINAIGRPQFEDGLRKGILLEDC